MGSLNLKCDRCSKAMRDLEPHEVVNDKYLCLACAKIVKENPLPSHADNPDWYCDLKIPKEHWDGVSWAPDITLNCHEE